MARIPFTGEPFFTSDLGLGLAGGSRRRRGVPVAAVLAGIWTLAARPDLASGGHPQGAGPPAAAPGSLLAPVVAIALLLAARPG